MAEGTVTERRLRPIRDAVDAGNWKQALKECEKWQKKGEKSDRFLVQGFLDSMTSTLTQSVDTQIICPHQSDRQVTDRQRRGGSTTTVPTHTSHNRPRRHTYATRCPSQPLTGGGREFEAMGTCRCGESI